MSNGSPEYRAARLAFGEHFLDVQRRELRRGGELVPMEPQVFDVLVYLVANRDRVVGKDDLIDAVWGGRIVSDSAVTTRINAVRRAVGDSGAAQQVIRTVSRKGVRFVAEVQEEGPSEPVEPEPAAAPARPALSLPRKPAIAVLPFQNMSADPDHFADGMVEEIITALAHIRGLFVIARNSSFMYKGQAVDVRRVGRELGVGYVLEGSVRRTQDRVRITGQLVEAENGAHLWADRYDGSLDDVLDLQDRVASSIAGVIGPTVREFEFRRG
jgi:TolB-like protein